MESSPATGSLRVLRDPPLDGPTNMGRDEALMTRVGQGASVPTLRLYQWDAPTISLGYFQPFDARASLEGRVREFPVVRRLTGGGAILHDREVTYSLMLPINHPVISGGANRLYELVHAAIIASLGELGIHAKPCGTTDDTTPTRGPFFCFARRHRFDVLVGVQKIVGSAQRRTRSAILQHGSIILASPEAAQPAAAIDLPVPRVIDHLYEVLPPRVASALDLLFEVGRWTPDELTESDATRLKYAGSEWTRRT